MTHVALFAWKPGTSDQQVAELAVALRELPELIADVRAFRCGPDAGVAAGNDHFAVVAEFDDVQAYLRYASDPRHREVIDRLIAPILGSRHAVQFEDEPG